MGALKPKRARRPRHVTVMMLDIVTSRRAVKLPTLCPGCKADLTEPHAVREWQITDERWSSRLAAPNITPSSDEGDEGNGTLVDYIGGSDSGSGDNVHYGPVSLWCASCSTSLAEGQVTHQEV